MVLQPQAILEAVPEQVAAYPESVGNSRDTDSSTTEASGSSIQGNTEEKTTVATSLVAMVERCGVAFYHDDTQRAWARFPYESHVEVAAVQSPQFRRWIAARFYSENKRTPNAQAVADAIVVLEGKAIHEGDLESVHVRLAERDGAIYLDLGNSDWQYVKIDESGWSVVSEAPVLFRRPSGMVELPTPLHNGSLDDLRALVNATEDDWVLILGWLVAAFRPCGPYPVLAVSGEQGSAKSTTCKAVRRVVDPNKAELRAAPRSVDDLIITATHSHIVSLDNLSGLKPWLADALCRLATGGGMAKRALYSDGDEVIFDVTRPILANGIEELTTRSDLLDRALMISLPTIAESDRKTESDYWQEFDQALPGVLGALLSAVSTAMRRLPDVRLARLPRMADFVKWVTAAEPALGLSDGEFLEVYERNRSEANELAIEAHPIAKTILDMMESTAEWSGTATELLAHLVAGCDGETTRLNALPKSPSALGSAIRRIAPNLRESGVEVELGTEGRGKTKKRGITLRWISSDNAVPAVPAEPTGPEPT